PMAKLVVLTHSMAGRSYDLATERTTVGRVEDNAFQIAEPSVSSRHCEILLRGGDIVVKDLNSTNGTFINGEKVSESVLKPGQTLRLGNVELKLDAPGAPAASAPATPAASHPAPASPTKKESAKVVGGGISIEQLESAAGRSFDTTKDFTKKKPGKTLYIWVAVGVVLLIIIILILIVIGTVRSNSTAMM
ncbi:MAG: FHA domain-containing protein, partial [Limisphaerales bacterium]